MTSDDASPWFDPTGTLGRLRHLFALLVAAHGIAHLVGTSEAIDAIDVGSETEYLFGSWSLSNDGLLWASALAWAAMTGVWLITAIAIWTDRPGWPIATIAASSASLVLCLLALPPSAVGVAVDVGLIVVAILVRRSAWSDGSIRHHRPHHP